MNIDRPRWYETRWRWYIVALWCAAVYWGWTVAAAEFMAAR